MHDYIIGFLNGVIAVAIVMTVYNLIKESRYRRKAEEYRRKSEQLWHLAERE